MKKWLFVGIFLFILIQGIFAVRINEIELNPNDTCKDCTEWLELYSDVEINLTGWKLVDASNNNFELNETFNGCYIIENPGISLNNVNEQIFLYNGTELIDQTEIISDSQNNIKTWQYCNGEWNFTDSTRGSKNSCEDNGDNGNGNTGDEEEPEIYLEIDWNDEDIINGLDFEVEIKAFNLKDEFYNFKIWIEFKENDTVISDRYDAEGEEWKSGKYYVGDLFEGPGDETEDIKLRIRGDYKDFYGRAKIFFKIESEEENDKYIDILEKEDEDEENVPKIIESIQTAPITGSVIKLGTSEVSTETEDIKTQDNIVYESKTELIKKYSIYGFALLCVGICILLGFKKLK